MVHNQSTGGRCKLVKEMGVGGITYIPHDPAVEGRNRITSAVGIDFTAETCAADKHQSFQRKGCVEVNPTVGLKTAWIDGYFGFREMNMHAG